MARGIDHLVIAVRDLDAASRFYERLGFQVGARNRHPWGTENRLIQLPGSFVELVTVGEGAAIPPHGPRSFSFGAFVRDHLARREGFAMLVLDSNDAVSDAKSFANLGIGDFEPLFFERQGRRPDGSESHVAFTLSFAQDHAAPAVGFFVCQHHRPDDFWNEAFQRHPNGTVSLTAVAMAAAQPDRHRLFLEKFTEAAAQTLGSDLSFALSRGRLDVLTSDSAAAVYGSVDVDADSATLVAFNVAVADLARRAHQLDAAEVPYQKVGSRLVVPSSAAMGVAIAFEPTSPTTLD